MEDEHGAVLMLRENERLNSPFGIQFILQGVSMSHTREGPGMFRDGRRHEDSRRRGIRSTSVQDERVIRMERFEQVIGKRNL
jgi:hypothetical protein